METIAHRELKRLAVSYLRAGGCGAMATEVRCPIARFRVDVAGWFDRPPDPAVPAVTGPDKRRCDPRTVVIERKQARADFLRDGREADRLLAARRELDRLRRRIEEDRIKAHEPHLRRSGTALFPELEVWDFAESRMRGYRKLLRRIEDLERRLYGETKFFTIARYRLADLLYLAAPRGMIRRGEVPTGWGLLEVSPRRLDRRGEGAPLRAAVEAPPQATRPEHRVRLLRNIAAAASRRAFGEKWHHGTMASWEHGAA